MFSSLRILSYQRFHLILNLQASCCGFITGNSLFSSDRLLLKYQPRVLHSVAPDGKELFLLEKQICCTGTGGKNEWKAGGKPLLILYFRHFDPPEEWSTQVPENCLAGCLEAFTYFLFIHSLLLMRSSECHSLSSSKEYIKKNTSLKCHFKKQKPIWTIQRKVSTEDRVGKFLRFEGKAQGWGDGP